MLHERLLPSEVEVIRGAYAQAIKAAFRVAIVAGGLALICGLCAKWTKVMKIPVAEETQPRHDSQLDTLADDREELMK